jgi:hypothetical protein
MGRFAAILFVVNCTVALQASFPYHAAPRIKARYSLRSAPSCAAHSAGFSKGQCPTVG